MNLPNVPLSLVKCIITRPENIGSFPLIGFISLLFIYNVSVTHMWQRLKVVSMTNTEEFLSRQQNFSISYFAFLYSQICYKWCSSYGYDSYKSLRISLRLKKLCEVVDVCIDSAGFLSSLFIMPFWLHICFIFLVSLKIDTDGWRPPDSSNRILYITFGCLPLASKLCCCSKTALLLVSFNYIHTVVVY